MAFDPGTSKLTRRTFAGALAGAAALSSKPLSHFTSAQSPSGSIRVGFEQGHVSEPFLIETADSLRAAYPGSEIELEPFAPGDYSTQMVLQLSMGRAPDVFMLSGVAIAELATSGLVAPLDRWLNGWDGWQYIPEVVRAAIAYDESIWGLPFPIDTHFLYYRKDLFTQAGLPTDWQPTHPDDILSAARSIRDASPNVIPYALYAGANGGNGTVVRGFIPLVSAHGGTLTDASGLWIIDSCAIREALQYYEQAYQIDETVPQDVMTGASPVSAMRQALGEGDLGILYEGCWTYQPWVEAYGADAFENIGFALFPSAVTESPFAVGGVGNCLFINASSESQELAWAFIAEFNSAANQTALNLTDPHIPAREDAAADPAFQETAFLSAMVESASVLRIAPPDPAFRELIAVVQNATGIVASGEASPEESVARYASELTRILGEENVTTQPCE